MSIQFSPYLVKSLNSSLPFLHQVYFLKFGKKLDFCFLTRKIGANRSLNWKSWCFPSKHQGLHQNPEFSCDLHLFDVKWFLWSRISCLSKKEILLRSRFVSVEFDFNPLAIRLYLRSPSWPS